jgi:tetratricopeptide (TPR) repeat protein
VAGEFEINRGRALETVFLGSLLNALLAEQDLPASVYLWTRDPAAFRQLSPSLTDVVFGSELVSASAADKRKDLVQTLEANNCEYLLEVRVFGDGSLVSITPYLLDLHTNIAAQPIPSRIVDADAIFREATSFADRIVEYIKQTMAQRNTKPWVEVGCHFVKGPATGPIAQKDVEVLARIAQRRLAQGISSSGRFLVKSTATANPWCKDLSSDVSGDVSAIASGEWSIKDNGIEVRPIVKVTKPDRLKQAPLLAVYLRAVTEPVATAISLPDQYARRVRTFLLAITDEDGSFPDIRSERLEATASSLAILQGGVRGGSDQLAALAAYRELSQSPDSAEAYYVLGKIFQRKLDYSSALENFTEAIRRESMLPPEVRADLNQATGNSYVAMGALEESLKCFYSAKSLYVSLHKDTEVRETTRALAQALYRLGKKDEASRELQSLGNPDKDPQTLRLLGRFAALAGKQDEASDWLTKALLIDPHDDEARALLANVYDAAGQKELALNNLAGARRYLLLALANRDDVRVRYQAATVSYRLGAFDEAISGFKKIVEAPADKEASQWVDSAWLTMLECYLLTKDYADVETEAGKASAVVTSLPRATVIKYLRFVSRVLSTPSATGLADDALYRELKNVPAQASPASLNWSNDKIDDLVEKELATKDASLDPERRRLIDEVTKALFP